MNEKEDAIVSFLHPDYKDTKNVWVPVRNEFILISFIPWVNPWPYYKD